MIDSIIPFLIAHPILFIGLSYTQPSSPARFALQGIIFICCFISRLSTFSLSIPGQAGGQYIYGMMMQSSHFMLLAKATPSAYGKPGNELKWSMDMLFSARWGVSPKMLPAFRRKDKSYVPTRWRFLVTRSWDLIWTVAMIYIINHYQLNIWPDDFTGVPDGFLRRLPSVTPREWAIRIYVAVVGKFEPYLALRAGHSLVSIIGVGVLSDDPKRYPPLFGSIKEAYRVRRFYVYFWHHLIRKAFTSHSSFVINDIFRVPRQTEASRYLVLVLTFFMSAWMHVFVSPNIPLRCNAWPQIRFYFSIAGAIILEDVVTLIYRQLTRKKVDRTKSNGDAVEPEQSKVVASTAIQDENLSQNNKLKRRNTSTTKLELDANPQSESAKNEPPSKTFRTLGFMWVAAFEVWSTSKFLYLTQQCLTS